ncbi:GNAT family N-acetyltransferase [Nonomuraea sediminis]|uniref:GNAT family N-acetyltransferase n=1 Tax=Nonomuraea sediminis TaxID=2835864 RepID=UPI001BDCB2C8|nr:GNAT family N-acetyltransferase [Nonomuraea sediminis]
MFDADVRITTDRLVLRPFRPDDADRIRSIVTSGMQFLPPGTPAQPAGVAQWLATGVHELWRTGQGVHLAMVEEDTGVVGAISLFKTSWGAGTTEVGYGVHPLYRGRGFATEAVRGLVDWIFATTELRRVDLTANLDNVASLLVARKAGFTWEGVVRGGAMEDDGPHDLVIFGLLRGDSRTPSKALPRTELRSSRLRLRPLGEADVPDLAATGADELTRANTGVPRGYNRHDAAAFVAMSERMRLRGHGIAFGVEELASGRFVANVDLRDLDWGNLTTEVGYMVAPWARGNGYAGEAVVTIARWLFGEHGFRRIQLRAAVSNTASQRVAEKAGFTREGVARNALDGQDLVVYGLTPGDLGL